VTAISSGTVTARATASDGSGVFGELAINISSEIVLVSNIKIKSTIKSSFITSVNGTLQLEAEIAPTDATDQTVTWSIINGTGEATITEKGLVTALSEGTVTAIANANDGSGVYGEFAIDIEFIKISYNRYEITVWVPDPLIPTKASLYNLQGLHIGTRNVESNECKFDISALRAGIYIVSIYNSTIQEAAKIIIAY